MGGGRPELPTLWQQGRRGGRPSLASDAWERTSRHADGDASAVGKSRHRGRPRERCPSSPSPAEGDTSGSVTSGEDRKTMFLKGEDIFTTAILFRSGDDESV